MNSTQDFFILLQANINFYNDEKTVCKSRNGNCTNENRIVNGCYWNC